VSRQGSDAGAGESPYHHWRFLDCRRL
jgi:hypothetical protein